MRYLIIVDMQKDFVDGTLGTMEACEIVPNVCEKIRSFDGEIIITQDTHLTNYLDTREGRNLPIQHCIKGTNGWELNSSVYAAIKGRKDTVPRSIMKPTFGSVELGEYLVDKSHDCDMDEVVLVGLCTDICVISNALLIKAFLPEVKVTVDAACCAGVTPESHENALKAMKMCQIDVENWEE